MLFSKSEYMKLITRLPVEQRYVSEKSDLFKHFKLNTPYHSKTTQLQKAIDAAGACSLALSQNDVVGATNSLYSKNESDIYYSNVIDQYQKGNSTVWNWSAALFQGKWLIYRGMFFYAFLYICLIVLPGAVCIDLIFDSLKLDNYEDLFVFIGFIWLFFDPLSFFIFGKFGNRLYFRFLNKKIAKGWHFVPRQNTHGWLVFLIYFFNISIIFLIPYYIYKKISFNKALKKAKTTVGNTA